MYGIKLANIINLEIHQKKVQGNRKEILPSKLPSKFGIQLHIDDDITVKQNGILYGFKVLILDRNDEEWVQKVLDEASRLRSTILST